VEETAKEELKESEIMKGTINTQKSSESASTEEQV
jgi:hypothetical protein